jgi:hypothetical protein
MRLFAFAALLALPLFAVAAPAAKADYYKPKCCGESDNGQNSYYGYHGEFKHYYVKRPAVVFGCDGYHCQTGIKLKPETTVKAACDRGWCRIKSHHFKNAWVLEECLKEFEDEGGTEEGQADEGHHEGGYERKYEGGYERRYESGYESGGRY